MLLNSGAPQGSAPSGSLPERAPPRAPRPRRPRRGTPRAAAAGRRRRCSGRPRARQSATARPCRPAAPWGAAACARRLGAVATVSQRAGPPAGARVRSAEEGAGGTHMHASRHGVHASRVVDAHTCRNASRASGAGRAHKRAPQRLQARAAPAGDPQVVALGAVKPGHGGLAQAAAGGLLRAQRACDRGRHARPEPRARPRDRAARAGDQRHQIQRRAWPRAQLACARAARGALGGGREASPGAGHGRLSAPAHEACSSAAGPPQASLRNIRGSLQQATRPG
jgi:hypothetical protein